MNKPLKGFTPLHLAAMYGHSRCVELLIVAGVDVEEISRCHRLTPLQLAVRYGCEMCINLLLQAGADVNERDKDGPLLFTAIKKGFHRCAEALINAGADVNGKVKDEPLLFTAIKKGFHHCVEALLEAGADMNEPNFINYGVTPLIYAMRLRQDKCFNVVIQMGADVNITDRTVEGSRPLFEAVSQNSRKYIEILVEAGANVNIKEQSELTPLYQAMSAHSPTCLKILLASGSKISMIDYTIGYLCSRGRSCRGDYHKEMINLLYAAGEGEEKFRNLPDYLPDPADINLMNICRVRIRNHLLELDPHENLFVRVSHLGLPPSLANYLLYNQKVIGDDGDDSNRADQKRLQCESESEEELDISIIREIFETEIQNQEEEFYPAESLL